MIILRLLVDIKPLPTHPPPKDIMNLSQNQNPDTVRTKWQSDLMLTTLTAWYWWRQSWCPILHCTHCTQACTGVQCVQQPLFTPLQYYLIQQKAASPLQMESIIGVIAYKDLIQRSQKNERQTGAPAVPSSAQFSCKAEMHLKKTFTCGWVGEQVDWTVGGMQNKAKLSLKWVWAEALTEIGKIRTSLFFKFKNN